MSDGDSNPDERTTDHIPDTNSQFQTQDHDSARSARIHSSNTPVKGGEHFGPFLIHSLLGQGGFGQVWDSIDQRTGRRVALKVLTSIHDAPAEQIERFKQEGKLAASINHPNCVYVFGAEDIEGFPAITMELMQGTLQDDLKRGGPFQSRRAVDAIMQIIDGLEAASRLGIVHRDIKPSNCFVDHHGRVKIGDFGLSKTFEVDADLTQSGVFMGTPAFASPEQAKGREVDFRSDIYSVGATLFTLLTGALPFSGKNPGEVLARVTSESPEIDRLKGDTPADLKSVITQCLQKDPADRFQSYSALRNALNPFSTEGTKAADLLRRFAAFMFDLLVLMILVIFLSRAWYHSFLLTVFYFGLTEFFLQGSFGKRLLGVRVKRFDGSKPDIFQTFLRSLILAISFFGFIELGGLLIAKIASQEGFLLLGWRSATLFISLLMPTCAVLVLFFKAKESNGYLGLHERLSHTHTIVQKQPKGIAIAKDAQPLASPIPDSVQKKYGPYDVLNVLSQDENSFLLRGYDPLLQRDVWIYLRKLEAGMNQATPQDSRMRLQWLYQESKDDWIWTAYEAPKGASFCTRASKEGVSWPLMQSIIQMLIVESGQDASLYHLSRIWINDQEQPQWLDFPYNHGVLSSNSPEFQSQKEFIHHVLCYGLDRQAQGKKSGEFPTIPLPAHSDRLVEMICSRNYNSNEELLKEIQATSSKTQSIDWQTKMSIAFIIFLFFMVFNLFALIVGLVQRLGYFEYFPLLLFTFGIFWALPVAIVGFLFRGGLSYKLTHVCIKTTTGLRASRIRCGLRSFLSSIPLVLGPVGLAIVISGFVYSVWSPQRGIQDLICGTTLVPE